MKLKNVQKQVTKVFLDNLKRDKIKISDDYLMVKLGEEVGELMQAYIIHKKKCRPEKYLTPKKSKKGVAKELSDVVCLSLIISKILKIDLEEAITKKWITKEWVKKR